MTAAIQTHLEANYILFHEVEHTCLVMCLSGCAFQRQMALSVHAAGAIGYNVNAKNFAHNLKL